MVVRVADGFRIAEAYVEVSAKVDDTTIREDADRVGADAGGRFGDRFSSSSESRVSVGIRGVFGRMFGNAESDAETAGDDLGHSVGKSAASGMNAETSVGLANWVTLIGAAAPIAGGAILAGLSTVFAVVGVLALKSNAQVDSAFSNLGTTVTQGLQHAAAPLIPFLVNIANQFSGTFKAILPQLGSLFAAVGPQLQALASGISSFTLNLMPGFSAAIRAAGPVMDALRGGLAGLGSGLSGFLQGLSTGAAGFAQGFSGLFSIIQGILPVLGSLIGELGNALGPVLQALAPGITMLVQSLGAALQPVIQALTPILVLFAKTFSQILQAVSPLLPMIGNIAASFLNAMMPAFQAIAPLLPQIAGMFANLALQILPPLMPMIPMLAQAFVQVVQALVPLLPQLLQLAEQLLPIILPLIPPLVTAIGDLAGWLSGALKKGIELVCDGISTLIDWVKKIKQWFSDLSDGVKKLGDKLSDTWNSVVSWTKDAWQKVKDAVTNAINDAVSFVTGLPGRVVSAIGDVGSILWNAGKSIIDGFLNGLKAAWSNVTSFVSGIGSWIAAHKGPIEYDRTLLTPHGNAIMGGLLSGLQNGAGGVLSYLDDFTKQIGNTSVTVPGAGIGAAGQPLGPSQAGVPLPAGVISAGGIASPSTAASAGNAGVSVAQLHLHIAGNLDPTNPTAWRQALENIRAGLRSVERSYAT